MGTPSNYKHMTPSDRKQLVRWLNHQNTFWHNYTDKCWYDDGYDESDVNEIIADIKFAVDQGTSISLRDCIKSGGSNTPDPRHIDDYSWIAQVSKTLGYVEPVVKEARVVKHEISMRSEGEKPKIDVSRKTPKVVAPPPPPPKRYTIDEDCQEVERLIGIIESVDNMNIIRTPESVKRIATWIREDEYITWRYTRPISCEQVRTILKEFEK